jgi:hypothetical protein
VHDAPAWQPSAWTADPSWRWVRVGTYELPKEAFLLKMSDAHGRLKIDQVLFTSDLHDDPSTP